MTVRDAWPAVTEVPRMPGGAGRSGRINMWKVIAIAMGAGIAVYALMPSPKASVPLLAPPPSPPPTSTPAPALTHAAG